MANKTYVTKGYSTYTNIPALRGGYDHDLKHPSNRYGLESKTLERVRAPTGYDFVGNGSPSKVELLKEYVHPQTMSGSPKPKNHYDDHEPNYGVRYDNSSPPISPNKHNRGYFSEGSNRTHSGPGYVRTKNVYGSDKSWQAVGPPATHHPLTTPANNVNEALGLLEESVYYSPRADPRQRGGLDDLSTRAQPLEPQMRYARPAFVAKYNDAHNDFTNTGSRFVSHDVKKIHRGALVP